MIKFGQVTAYNTATKMATISYIRPDACEKCGGCNAMSQTGSITLKADCKEGDWVRVELPDNRFLSATFMAYVIPLIFFVAGLLLGNSLSGGNELWAMGGSLIGLGLGLACMKICDTTTLCSVMLFSRTMYDLSCYVIVLYRKIFNFIFQTNTIKYTVHNSKRNQSK